VSQGNVERARRAVEAYNRLDVDLLLDANAHEDFEWYPAMPGAVEGRGYRGRREIEEYLEEIRCTWEQLRVVDAVYRDLGDSVLVLGRIEGRGLGSGVEVDAPIGLLFELRGDTAWRSRAYLDHDQAMRAAGLKEQGTQ
jgi:ketosteroid isomerase-like protein